MAPHLVGPPPAPPANISATSAQGPIDKHAQAEAVLGRHQRQPIDVVASLSLLTLDISVIVKRQKVNTPLPLA
jgi:hypothetical protein